MKSDTQNTEILEEIKLANNDTQTIPTACEILNITNISDEDFLKKITNISDEDFLKKPNKTKKEIRDKLKELEKHFSIAKEKYKHFTNIWCDSIKQKLQNPSLQEDQRNETPKEIKLINHNTQATDTTDKISKTMNISDKTFLEMSYENRCTLINELTIDSSYDNLEIKRNHFMELHLLSMAGDLYLLSETNESCHFTLIVNKDKRDATTKLKVLVQNQETSNKLRKLFERGISDHKLNFVVHLSIITLNHFQNKIVLSLRINKNYSNELRNVLERVISGHKLNFVIHRSIITLNQYDYSYNNSLKDIESYSKYTLINTDIQKDKTTKLSITEHNNSLNNQLTTPLENRSDKKSSSVTYTHTQKDSKITKSIASGIGFVTGSFLGITIIMLVTELPFFTFTFVSALVGAIIGYGVATLYEKVSEKRGKNTEVNTCTILKDVSTLECFKGNSNKFEAHVSH